MARRAPDSTVLSQKIVGSGPCPEGDSTVVWLAGPEAGASTWWAHGVGASTELVGKGSGPSPFSRVGSRAQPLFGWTTPIRGQDRNSIDGS